MEKHTWHKAISLSPNTLPSPRWGHASCLADGQLVIFGGYAGSSFLMQTPSIRTISGPTTPPTWPGSSGPHTDLSPRHDRIAPCIMMPPGRDWSFLVEAGPTNFATMTSQSSTGRARNGLNLSPPRVKRPLGNALTTLRSCYIRICWFSEARA